MAAGARARGHRGALPIRGRARAPRTDLSAQAPDPRGARVAARGWGWRHAGRREAALAGIDLTIEPGQHVLLLGASGSGKSTFLHGLAGILGGEEEGEPSGELLVDGVPADRARGAAGLVLQDPETQAVLARVGDDVAFGLENLGVEPERMPERIRHALDAVGLKLSLDHDTGALSGGQKQRLALAGVLAMQPRLLLLDEPTANLDPAGSSEVVDAVLAASTGRTLVVVEHRVELWWPHVDRVVVLGAGGGILADGAPDAVLAAARAELDDAGVWLPGTAAAMPSRGPAPGGEVLLGGTALELARDVPRRRRARQRARERGHLRAVARVESVRVEAGTTLALTGANGAGKTTLALTLAGLLAPLRGEVVARDALAGSAGSDPIRWRSSELAARIGVVFQSPDHQFLTASVRDELERGPRVLGRSATEARTISEELLDRLGLARLARAHPFALSGGEKRRLSVATALATSPRVLVLDEPTFGQDARTWNELVGLLAAQRDAGCGIVVVTHDRDLVRVLEARELDLGRTGSVPEPGTAGDRS